MSKSLYKHVRIRLTVFNLLVMIFIMSVTLTVVYVFMKNSMIKNAENMMQLISNNSKINVPNTKNIFLRPTSQMYFYIRLDKNNRLIGVSRHVTLSKDILHSMKKIVLSSPSSSGTIHLQSGEEFRFLRHPKNGMIVFANMEIEQDMLNRLLFVLIVTGLLGIILFVFGSILLSSRAIRPIKESVERQRSFVADASHELRTPLAVMQTNLEILKENPQATLQSQAKWLQNIVSETQRMTKLVEDLLTLARSDSGQIILDKTVFSLPALLYEVKDTFIVLINEKKLAISISPDCQIQFYGDRARIRQLFVILLDNAIKYSKKNGSIQIVIQDLQQQLIVSMQDTGIGIDAVDIDKIFDRFYRADKSRSSENGGVGLGLSIAQWIVNEHHGNITVSSTVGAGTIFTIQLPKLKEGYH